MRGFRTCTHGLKNTFCLDRMNLGKRQQKLNAELQFCTVKCKLNSITISPAVKRRLNEVATLAHDIYKRASLFFRAYCLWASSFPPVTLSALKNSINCMCTKSGRGVKPKIDVSFKDDMSTFWKLHFSKIYPDLLAGEGLSMLKQLLADQMLSCILVDTKTHFKSRLAKFIHFLVKRKGREQDRELNSQNSGEQEDDVHSQECLEKRWTAIEKKEAFRIASSVFANKWVEVPPELKYDLRSILPSEPRKNVAYDLTIDPSRYVESTLRISRLMGDVGNLVTFMPTRRSNVPCHCKLDTETIAQLFVSYSERVQQRKAAEDRIAYNNWVWSGVLQLNTKLIAR